MQATTKQVGYAYPTSDTAGRLGFGKTGCYFFRLLFPGGGWSQRDKGFTTEQEALEYAETQPEPYDRYSLRPDGSKPWLQADRIPPAGAAGSKYGYDEHGRLCHRDTRELVS